MALSNNRFRLITPDLRGHGRSDKPRPPETYTDGKRWAEDIAAIIDGLELERPILLAWSYSDWRPATFFVSTINRNSVALE